MSRKGEGECNRLIMCFITPRLRESKEKQKNREVSKLMTKGNGTIQRRVRERKSKSESSFHNFPLGLAPAQTQASD